MLPGSHRDWGDMSKMRLNDGAESVLPLLLQTRCCCGGVGISQIVRRHLIKVGGERTPVALLIASDE